MAATQPVDIVNRALDECGCPPINDLLEGSVSAKAALRVYDSTLRQLFSAAHWNFARKQDTLVLMADVNGLAITNTDVPGPWNYMYEWPTDCVHARFVPYTGLTWYDGAPSPAVTPSWNSPSPFFVASAPRLNDATGNWYLVEGHDPDQTRVILSNQLGASLVDTGLLQYPDAWDPLFEQAFVATLAARLAMPCNPDKAFARQVRADNIQIARGALDAARVRDGDEGWTVQNHTPDWIRARISGPAWDGPGVLYYPWSPMPFVDDAGGVY